MRIFSPTAPAVFALRDFFRLPRGVAGFAGARPRRFGHRHEAARERPVEGRDRRRQVVARSAGQVDHRVQVDGVHGLHQFRRRHSPASDAAAATRRGCGSRSRETARAPRGFPSRAACSSVRNSVSRNGRPICGRMAPSWMSRVLSSSAEHARPAGSHRADHSRYSAADSHPLRVHVERSSPVSDCHSCVRVLMPLFIASMARVNALSRRGRSPRPGCPSPGRPGSVRMSRSSTMKSASFPGSSDPFCFSSKVRNALLIV